MVRRRSVVQCDMNWNYIKTYPGAKDAEIDLNITHGGVYNCCQGTAKSAGGYRWMYEDEYKEMYNEK